MSKGDHVFNNIVAKLTKTFEEGLIEYFTSTGRSLAGADRDELVSSQVKREQWMSRHMPRTLEALEHFRHHPELVAAREKLQTIEYQGNDPNGAVYSQRAEDFREAVQSFFWKIAHQGSYADHNVLLPEIRAVRRAFSHMTGVAEDAGAAQRLLDEASNSPERARIEADLAKVRNAMQWAWGRCEYLFRMLATEHRV